MDDIQTYFITWTTYGAWLPGDLRGWRKHHAGDQQPRPLLENWCRDQMVENSVVLTPLQRKKLENVCREHATIRNWNLHAISARSNHVHVVVGANEKPDKIRDQFKANATRVLRQPPEPIANIKIWTRGGDVQFVKQDDMETVVQYVLEAQERMDRGK